MTDRTDFLIQILGGCVRKAALAWALLLFPAIGQAADYQQIANMCVACHGSTQDTSFPSIPNLKWQNKPYLVEQLTAFKSGQRSDKTMSKVAQLLSEQDIEQLATYFYTLNHKGSQ
nr:cytochrome c [Vibrio chagasii]